MKLKLHAISLAYVLALSLLVLSASAADRVVVCVQNNTGVAASDLHVTFTGTGGNIYVDPFSVVAIGCPTPLVTSNGAITNTADIDWGVACVAPGSTVMFIASTVNGPLGVASGTWTAGGATIGPISLCRGFPKPLPPGGGGGGKWGALKIQNMCVPNAPAFYTGCQQAPNGICWDWFRCIPGGVYWWRAIWCPYANRTIRLFEVPPWYILTPWMQDGTFPQCYMWIRLTTPDPPPLPMFGPPVQPVTNGPPPFPPQRPRTPFPPHRHSFQVRYSDDGGGTFRQSGDFIQSFFDIFLDLDVLKPTANVFATNFPAVMTELAPRYANAAQTLNPLIAELRDVETNEPNPTVTQIRVDTEALQSSFLGIATEFEGGHVLDPTPYQNAAIALNDMSQRFMQMGAQLSLPRLNDVARSLRLISEAFAYAVTQVNTGMMDTSPGVQDNFYWALQDRAFSEWHLAGSAAVTHVRILLPLNGWSWSKSAIDQVRVRIQDANSSEILEDFFVPISDGSYFDVPYLLPEGLPVRLWFKLPTHLSVVLNLNLQDGLLITTPQLVAGDANGDNCVDSFDLLQVENDAGTGGTNSVSVSSSDVNGDGIVNQTDFDIVSANMGQCGQMLSPPLLKPFFDPSGSVDLAFPFDFDLQSTPSLSAPSWTTYPTPPQVLGPAYHVILSPPLSGNQFFRATSSAH